MLPVFGAASTDKPSPCAPPAPCCTAARSRLKRYRRSRGSLSASRRPARAWTPPLMNLGRCPSADLAPCVYHVHTLRRSSHVKKGVWYPVHTYHCTDLMVKYKSRLRPTAAMLRAYVSDPFAISVPNTNIKPHVLISLLNLIAPRGSHGALIDNTRWRSP